MIRPQHDVRSRNNPEEGALNQRLGGQYVINLAI